VTSLITITGGFSPYWNTYSLASLASLASRARFASYDSLASYVTGVVT